MERPKQHISHAKRSWKECHKRLTNCSFLLTSIYELMCIRGSSWMTKKKRNANVYNVRWAPFYLQASNFILQAAAGHRSRGNAIIIIWVMVKRRFFHEWPNRETLFTSTFHRDAFLLFSQKWKFCFLHRLLLVINNFPCSSEREFSDAKSWAICEKQPTREISLKHDKKSTSTS